MKDSILLLPALAAICYGAALPVAEPVVEVARNVLDTTVYVTVTKGASTSTSTKKATLTTSVTKASTVVVTLTVTKTSAKTTSTTPAPTTEAQGWSGPWGPGRGPPWWSSRWSQWQSGQPVTVVVTQPGATVTVTAAPEDPTWTNYFDTTVTLPPLSFDDNSVHAKRTAEPQILGPVTRTVYGGETSTRGPWWHWWPTPTGSTIYVTETVYPDPETEANAETTPYLTRSTYSNNDLKRSPQTDTFVLGQPTRSTIYIPDPTTSPKWPGSKPPGSYPPRTTSSTSSKTRTRHHTPTDDATVTETVTTTVWTTGKPHSTTKKPVTTYYDETSYEPTVIEATLTLPPFTYEDNKVKRVPQTWVPVSELPTETETDDEWIWPWWHRSTATPSATPRPTGVVTVTVTQTIIATRSTLLENTATLAPITLREERREAQLIAGSVTRSFSYLGAPIPTTLVVNTK